LDSLPNGKVVKIEFSDGEIRVLGSVAYGDAEVWDELKVLKALTRS